MSGVKIALALIFLAITLYLVYSLVHLLDKLLWRPYKTQKVLSSQGINGPGYSFFFGNARELLRTRKESLSKPMSPLSHDLVPRIFPSLHSWMKIHGKNFVFWIGPEAQLVVMDPEMVKQALFNKDGNFPKAELQSDYLRKILENGIVTTEGERWSKIRKLANFSFHGEKLKSMVPEMIDSAEQMLERWKNKQGKEIDVFEEFRVFTAQVISRTAFGTSFEQGRQIFDLLYRMTVLIERNIFKFKLPIISKIFKSSDDQEAERLEEGIRDRILGIVTRREEKVKNGETDGYGDDYLGLLIQAYHEQHESRKISLVDLVDECKTLYVAGQDTTNVLLSWVVLLLAIHHDWQEQARKEVVAFFGHDKSPDFDGLAKLKTMVMIINETLRLYPPVTGTLLRKVEQEVTLGKLTLPAGVRIQIPIISLHHDPEIWGEDVLLFNPGRFSKGVAEATNNNSVAFMPFGMGPRICAGFNFATNEVKIALSMIMQRYSFTLSPGYVHSPHPFLTVRPGKGVQVILHAL